MKKVIALVVTYNRKDLLKECLEAVLNQTYKVDKIILIDNNSTDGTDLMIQENEQFNSHMIQYYKMKKNLGGAGGFYEGLKICRTLSCDGIWIMDDDTIPNKECLENLLKARHNIDGKIGLLASSILGPENEPMNVPTIDMRPTDNGYTDWYKTLNKKCVKISAATFVSILISKDALLKCGLPMKDYFIWGDDTEYTMRISKNYGPCYLVGDSIAIHKRFNARSLDLMTEKNSDRIKMYRYYYRNTLINMKIYNGNKIYRTGIKQNIRRTIKLTLKGDLKRAKVIAQGTWDATTQHKNFESYISNQLENAVKYNKSPL